MKIAQAFANCGLDEIKALLDGGKLVIYSVARPPSPDSPVERSGVLATFAFASPAFAGEVPADSKGAVTAVLADNPVTATGVGTRVLPVPTNLTVQRRSWIFPWAPAIARSS